MKYILFVAVFLIINVQFSFAQGRVDGFYKGKGNIELAIGGGLEFASHYFAGTDKISLSREIYYSSLTVASGITDRFDIYLNIPYVMIGNESSIQDGSLFLKYLIAQKKLEKGVLSFSLAGGYSSNLADYQVGGVDAIGQQAKILDIRSVLHYQNGAWFATAQFAYNYKFDPVPNATNSSLKIGKATIKYYYDFWYENMYTNGGFDYKGTPAPPSFRELGESYHKVGGTFYKPLGQRFGSYLSAAYVLSGRTIGQGPIVNIGFVFKNL